MAKRADIHEDVSPHRLQTGEFRRLLSAWYRSSARVLPWRGVDDAYATWLSEVMLQQTRVATVIERYGEFLRRFPTVQALAAAKVSEVLALWSGLGYYRRARMLHAGAQYVVRELGGVMPRTAAELRVLPGVGEYTAAAVASIAFGERVAVVDGNVERVLLRVLGEGEDRTAAAKRRMMEVAQSLVPAVQQGANAPGDHNQAMMELGATLCLPRGPLCLQCPVVSLCRTRGEHATAKRAVMRRVRVAHLLAVRGSKVLLERRDANASLMAGMLELPPLALDAMDGLEPVARVKHSITNTNYQVEVFAETPSGKTLRNGLAAKKDALLWVPVAELREVPLTGLARKVLKRLGVMQEAGSRKQEQQRREEAFKG